MASPLSLQLDRDDDLDVSAQTNEPDSKPSAMPDATTRLQAIGSTAGENEVRAAAATEPRKDDGGVASETTATKAAESPSKAANVEIVDLDDDPDDVVINESLGHDGANDDDAILF